MASRIDETRVGVSVWRSPALALKCVRRALALCVAAATRLVAPEIVLARIRARIMKAYQLIMKQPGCRSDKFMAQPQT